MSGGTITSSRIWGSDAGAMQGRAENRQNSGILRVVRETATNE